MKLKLVLIIALLPLMAIAATGEEPFADVQSSPQAVFSTLQSSANVLQVECTFSVPPTGSVVEAGAAQPITRWVMLPDHGEASIVSVANGSLQPVETGFNDGEMQPLDTRGVSIGETIVNRGIRFAPVTFSPLILSNDGQVTARSSLTAEISLPMGEVPFGRLRPTQREMWGSLLLNGRGPGRDRTEETSEGMYIYVVPDNNQVRNALNPLIQWRRQQGYNTREITAQNWADGDLIYEQILNIDSPDTTVDYILLAGDATGEFSVPTMARGVPSDYYYTLLDGPDRFADAAVGRISYNSIAELQRIVAKILAYEREPEVDNQAWYRQAAVAAGSRISGFSTILNSKWVRDQLMASGFTSVDTLWFTMGGSVADFMEEAFDNGSAYVTYRGWTGLEDWTPEQAANLRNPLLPVAVLLACNSNDYVGQQAGFGEALLRAPGGAIGAIGIAGAQSRINFNNVLMAAYFRGVLEDGAYRLGWTLNRARVEMMATYGTREPELSFDHSAWANLMGDPATVIWRGVPRAVRVEAPQQVDYGVGSINVTVLAEADDRPLPGVRVGLSKGSEIAAGAFTDDEGRATIKFNARRVTAGEAIITASGDQVLPSSIRIQLTRPGRALFVTNVQIIEDNFNPRQGDGDGAAEPNEIVGINLLISNIGAQPVFNPIICVLESESDYVEVRQANARIDNQINPNGIAGASFLVALGSDFPDRESVPMLLTMRSGEIEWTSEFIFRGRAPRWEFVRHTIAAPPVPDSDESFDIFLRNTGNNDAAAFSAVLVSLDEDARVIDAQADYDALEIGALGSVGEVFSVHFGEELARGAAVDFQLRITEEAGVTAIIPFTITMAIAPRTEPTGPDTYGYYCIDNVDQGSNLRLDYRWVEINPALGGSGQNTGLLDQGEDDDESVVLDLPFTFQYYGERFDEITVCTNGWAAFGDQREYVDFRNMPIGSPQGPKAQLCPWWDDLYQPGIEAKVFYYFDPARHEFIIEWYRMRRWVGPAGPGGVETFEIVLKDPAWHQNTTGDGDIIFAYAETNHEGRVDAHGTPYATVGIGDLDDRGGLQLNFWNQFGPGVSPAFGGTIYRFVNAREHRYAAITGTVRAAADGSVIRGATVRATRGGWAFTGQDGTFRLAAGMADLPQRLEISAPGYITRLTDEFAVQFGQEAVFNELTLLQPQITVSEDSFLDSLAEDAIAVHRFMLRNPGDGRLEAKISIAEREDRAGLGERRFGWNATVPTFDSRILGIAFADSQFYVSGGNSGFSPGRIYRFDRLGNYLGRFNQPVRDSWGMRDLAWDGDTLFGGVAEWIIGIDRGGREMLRRNSPFIPARGLAVNPITDDFWIAAEGRPIIRLSRAGEVRRSYDHLLTPNGLAWHPADVDGCPLWIFSSDGPTGLTVSKLDTASGEIRHVVDLENQGGDHPGGIELTKRWTDDRSWILAAVIQNAGGDRVELYDAGSNLTWLTIAPAAANLDPNGSIEVVATVNTAGLQEYDYAADIVITHNAIDGEMRIPVDLFIPANDIDEYPVAPLDYRLEGVYPNPFNNSAAVRFSIPVPGQASLRIYDIQGRFLMDLASGRFEAGEHTELLLADGLAAGIYFVRLEAAGTVITRKFAIVK